MLSTVRTVRHIQIPGQGYVTGRATVNIDVAIPSVVKVMTPNRQSVV